MYSEYTIHWVLLLVLLLQELELANGGNAQESILDSFTLCETPNSHGNEHVNELFVNEERRVDLGSRRSKRLHLIGNGAKYDAFVLIAG